MRSRGSRLGGQYWAGRGGEGGKRWHGKAVDLVVGQERSERCGRERQYAGERVLRDQKPIHHNYLIIGLFGLIEAARNGLCAITSRHFTPTVNTAAKSPVSSTTATPFPSSLLSSLRIPAPHDGCADRLPA